MRAGPWPWILALAVAAALWPGAATALRIGLSSARIFVADVLGIDRLMRAERRSPGLVHAASLVIAGLGLYWLLVRTVFA